MHLFTSLVSVSLPLPESLRFPVCHYSSLCYDRVQPAAPTQVRISWLLVGKSCGSSVWGDDPGGPTRRTGASPQHLHHLDHVRRSETSGGRTSSETPWGERIRHQKKEQISSWLFTLQYTVIYFCIIICSLGIRRYDHNYVFPSSLRVLLFSVFFHDRWNTGPYEIYMFSNLLFSIRIPIIILYFSIAAFFYIPTFQRALSYNFFPLHIHFSFYDISNPATTCGVLSSYNR